MNMSEQKLYTLYECDAYEIWRADGVGAGKRGLIKSLRFADESSARAAALRKLEREREFLQSVSYERILRVTGVRRETCELQMEDCQCTLRQMLDRQGKFNNELVASVMLQLLDVLAALARKKVGHGSLRLENIFVTPGGYLKLGDFMGFSFERRELPAIDPDALCHSAPEILDRGRGEISGSTDLYSVGYIALELLAGQEFAGLLGRNIAQSGRGSQLAKWHLSNQGLGAWQELLPDVSEALGEFINGLVEKDPARRPYKTAYDAMSELDRKGLHAMRVLPPYDSGTGAKAEQAGGPVFRPPVKRMGPILTIEEKAKETGGRITVEAPDVLGLGLDGRPAYDHPDMIFTCVAKDWYVYNLQDKVPVHFNGAKLAALKPRRIEQQNVLQIPGEKGQRSLALDIEFRGTSLIRDMELVKRIHRGQGGDLYLARWFRPQTTVDVAIRILPEEFQHDEEQIRRLLRAIPEAGKVASPTVVRMFKVGRFRSGNVSGWYIGHEYMVNGSLRDRVERERQIRGSGARMGLKSARKLAFGVARAIEATCANGVVHRNITPSCILFGNDDRVKLGDFTMARGEAADTMAALTRGKLCRANYFYQSPEILHGDREITYQADIYSLGVCLFEALAGCLPFPTDESEVGTITRMSAFEWPGIEQFRPSIPLEWRHLLGRMLQRRPTDRCDNPTALLNEIRSLPVHEQAEQ